MAVKTDEHYFNTGTPNAVNTAFGAGVKITYIDNAEDKASSTVVITPIFARVDEDKTIRYQHDWTQEFGVNEAGTIDRVIHYNGGPDGEDASLRLPNNTSGVNTVESSGHLVMKKGYYYQWGKSQEFTVRNDGKKRVIKFRMYVGTKPNNCPASGYFQIEYTPHKYKVTPTPPAPNKANFDDNTRTITYSWATPDDTCEYVSFTRETYNEYGIRLNGWGMGGPPDIVSNCISEVLDDNVAYVKWQVSHISVTDDVKESPWMTVNTEPEGKVWIKIGDQWKKAVPWILVDGQWKKVTKTYIKVGDTWKPTTT